MYTTISIQRESLELSQRYSGWTRASLTPRGEGLDLGDNLEKKTLHLRVQYSDRHL